MFDKLMYALWIVAALILGLAISNRVFAHQLSDDECAGMASTALTFAEHRDGGTTEEMAAHIVEMGLAHALGADGSYVKDEEDVNRVLKIVNGVWGSSHTPRQV